ncbi:uncharacterized protein SAPINGB_P003224 [Magnusiomyces paraingens]|uniref:CWH43-like N-terminal domain-containing protein n=1 Tax=Magnusiomyces paraingens TaxID=2606893 RepID=A0A5E8BKL9_9ASCO|nr:uncharacterized protein SAPINGB_P003224 [Saprochaete ingens]VVT51821.1 unnamed protein product [Saprochaete ingens]
MFRVFGHWQIPLVCAIVWWGMLIAMLAVWSAQGKPKYGTDRKDVVLVYISDIGAWSLQALFIACASVQAPFFILALAAERYLRHAGRLPPNLRRREKLFAAIAIILSIPGQVGIILVAVFNTVKHHTLHFSMLIMFLVCTGVSVLFTILEFGFLDYSYAHARRLRVSYMLKAFWLIIAIILAICFAALNRSSKDVAAAVFEWFLAFFYGMYLLILSYDLFPAFKSYSSANAIESGIDRTLFRVTSWWLPHRIKTSALAHPPLEKDFVETDSDPALSADVRPSTTPTFTSSSNNNNAANNIPLEIPTPDCGDAQRPSLGDRVYENRRNMTQVPTDETNRFQTS